MQRAVRIILLFLLALGLGAQDLAPETEAKFLKILLSSTGQFGFACSDAGFKMAWAASEAEARALKAAGKLVIVPKLAWLKAGAAIALVEEDGKPQIYLSAGNVKASGMTLSDTIVKMAKHAP